ncbi:hypothetical protein TWF481_007985 [Arthrobotrys musiformis]|uniref:Uncharacterized protein n=1 Tax=Arthrobotrys musiformis TaxID=47236 RepID=A0AAV9W5T9_9PEZI
MRAKILEVSLLLSCVTQAALADPDHPTTCIEVEQNFVPGQCSIKLAWVRGRAIETNGAIFYLSNLRGGIFDANKTRIADEPDYESQNCYTFLNTRADLVSRADCVFGSKFLPQKLVVSPTSDGENLELTYEGRIWDTESVDYGEYGCKFDSDWAFGPKRPEEGEDQGIFSDPPLMTGSSTVSLEVECVFPCEHFLVDVRPGKGKHRKCRSEAKPSPPAPCKPVNVPLPVPAPCAPVVVPGAPLPCIPVPCIQPEVSPMPSLVPVPNAISINIPNQTPDVKPGGPVTQPPASAAAPVAAPEKTTIETRIRSASSSDQEDQEDQGDQGDE